MRFRLLGVCLALGASALGCDAGGLLVVESKGTEKPPVIEGPSTTEMVNGGTVASNAKYKVVYTLGQPTPHQGVAKSSDVRSNGGLTGAMNGP